MPESNTWKLLPSMREARGRFQIAVISDKVFALGGSNGTTELDSVEMLDLNAGKYLYLIWNSPIVAVETTNISSNQYYITSILGYHNFLF